MYKTVLEEIENEQIERATRLAEAVKPLLEPAAVEAYLPDAATISLAISMKRIADFICGAEGRLDMVEYMGAVIKADNS